MDISNMLIELFDVFIFKEKNESKRKKRTKQKRPFSALSMRIGSKDTVYYFDNTVIKAKNGDICLVPQNTEYIRVAQEEEIIVFHFNVHNFIGNSIKCYSVANIEEYQSLFFQALKIWQAKAAGYRYEATSILYTILARLQKDGMILDSSEDKALSKAIEMIESSFQNHNFRVEDISKELFISPAGLRKKFKDRFGSTPKEYLDKRRINEAEIMLKANYFSQKEISDRCGFSDVKYFRYAFKKETGKTVTDYKKSLT